MLAHPLIRRGSKLAPIHTSLWYPRGISAEIVLLGGVRLSRYHDREQFSFACPLKNSLLASGRPAAPSSTNRGLRGWGSEKGTEIKGILVGSESWLPGRSGRATFPRRSCNPVKSGLLKTALLNPAPALNKAGPLIASRSRAVNVINRIAITKVPGRDTRQ